MHALAEFAIIIWFDGARQGIERAIFWRTRMVQLTPVAVSKVKEILGQQTPVPTGLRVAGGRGLLWLQLPHGL